MPKDSPQPRSTRPKRACTAVSKVVSESSSSDASTFDPLGSQPNSRKASSATTPKRRKSTRGSAGLTGLAQLLVDGKQVLFVTGAGLSVASGVRPFRSTTAGSSKITVPSKRGVQPTAGLWNSVIWTTATREAFLKDPVAWYNDFWRPYFADGKTYHPNAAHLALQALHEKYDVRQVTQNIDGLQQPSHDLIEAHGRVGLYKCIGSLEDNQGEDEDEDDEESSEENEDRPVHLGHRTISSELRKKAEDPETCPYQYLISVPPDQLEPEIRDILAFNPPKKKLKTAPRCPCCEGLLLPQALLFDEGYHDHNFYDFERIEAWLESSDALVFVGTSFAAVRLTTICLQFARETRLPVYNFNLHDTLQSTTYLNVTNIVGPCDETLPSLVAACDDLQPSEEID